MRFERKGSIARVVLAALEIRAVALVAVTVPNAAHALLPLVDERFGRRPNQRALERTIRGLKKRRLVRFIWRGGKPCLKITEKGRQRVREFEFESMALSLPARWDGQWTIILFDIPESYKRARDALRDKLKTLHCFQFHKSVFVHPADCGDEVDFISEFFDVRRFVAHFRAPSLGMFEHRAVRFFGLKRAGV